jgi:excisionase family DNA binding protein
MPSAAPPPAGPPAGPHSELGRFLTLADTAEVLNISATQAYGLVRSGELPAIKIGGNGHWRIERDVLEGYIAGKYEENRRRGLWAQAAFADVPELFADRDLPGNP